MSKKRNIIILVVLLTIGFAAVSTTLVLNGIVGIGTNAKDFDVYFSNAIEDGVENKNVITSDKTMNFTKEFTLLTDKYNLEYFITNGSYNYDAEVTINCTGANDYISLTNSWENPLVIKSTETASGILDLKMIKAYNNQEKLSVNITCSIVANALERDTSGSGVPAKKKPRNLYEKVKGLSLGSSSQINYNISSHYSENVGVGNEGYEAPGVYELDGENGVYFYRGRVDNNIVFGNYCWKIVRTTDTGGTKIIYNGVVNDKGQCLVQTGRDTTIGYSAFNEKEDDAKYVKYIVDGEDSTIKKYIEDWYGENMTSYTSYLEDAVWCNDTSILTDYSNIDTTSSIYDRYGAMARASYDTKNVQPSLACSQPEDRYTTKSGLLYPVGLITLDEIALAGGTSTKAVDIPKKCNMNYSINANRCSNRTFYLYNSDLYWTMTPIAYSTNYPTVGFMTSGTSLYSVNVTYEEGVRPMISLSNDVKIEGEGEGTPTNPYKVVLDKAQ